MDEPLPPIRPDQIDEWLCWRAYFAERITQEAVDETIDRWLRDA